MVIVDTPDALLVANRDESQKVKEIVEMLNANDRQETNFHRLVHRPWGTFDGMGRGNNYQVKCITVHPGHKLSVQKHFRRAEHWTVVKGMATVTLDDETFLLEENQSIFIPVEAIHSLENTGLETLELIEVQCGDYLGEDDIVRFEDRYGREGTNE
ncbi:MAG: cupin domain-containing protein [Sphingomonadales bacterium]|nr:cupin domain-containing protein [Sphingomonadales bacterium]